MRALLALPSVVIFAMIAALLPGMTRTEAIYLRSIPRTTQGLACWDEPNAAMPNGIEHLCRAL